ncbi:MAG: DUF512 domain-containing protein [Coriobacteriales bacterium]|nr:DUF512 domain-containing protein [Coriobacteriales bacterium]
MKKRQSSLVAQTAARIMSTAASEAAAATVEAAPNATPLPTTTQTAARIAHVTPESPAARAGLKPGMLITEVEGEPLRDIIDWLWLTDGNTVRLTVAPSLTSPARHITLSRTPQTPPPWGLTFTSPIFDKLLTCHNSCLFCFMTMLPQGMRPSLYERDDDYRLSFLQGNFVTLTNLSEPEIQRIISHRLSPLHVSLHAVTPATRLRLMGKNHARGLKTLDRLLRAGIQAHAQLVLVPGINDGPELNKTLAWLEPRPNILSVGIVPYGFTRHARLRTPHSPQNARRLIAQLAPWQTRSRRQTGKTRFQLADEWFLLARTAPPPAARYDGFPQFEDGIGMLRSFIDDWASECDLRAKIGKKCGPASQLVALPCSPPPTPHLVLVTGEAFAPTLDLLTTRTFPHRALEVLAVPNNFFGGNVSVAGLLTAQDIIAQLEQRALPPASVVVLPEVLFNADGLTLDDKTAEDIAQTLNRRVVVIPCTAKHLLDTIEAIAAEPARGEVQENPLSPENSPSAAQNQTQMQAQRQD